MLLSFSSFSKTSSSIKVTLCYQRFFQEDILSRILASFQNKNWVWKLFTYTKSCQQIGLHTSMIRCSFYKDITMKSYAG